MTGDDAKVTIARINARQAIAVALIGALAGVLTTLVGTGALSRSDAGGPGDAETGVETRIAELERENQRLRTLVGSRSRMGGQPEMAFGWVQVEREFEACKSRARQALEAAGASRLEDDQQSVYATLVDYRVGATCLTNSRLFVVAVAGPLSEMADELRDRIVGAMESSP